MCGQCIIGHTEKRIIRGVWLGSSAANTPSFSSVVQVGEVQGDWCTQQLPSAAIRFSAPTLVSRGWMVLAAGATAVAALFLRATRRQGYSALDTNVAVDLGDLTVASILCYQKDVLDLCPRYFDVILQVL